MPRSRSDFERNMHMLQEKMIRKQFFKAPGNEKTVKGIMNVRLTPNRRANIYTIIEVARLIAN